MADIIINSLEHLQDVIPDNLEDGTVISIELDEKRGDGDDEE